MNPTYQTPTSQPIPLLNRGESEEYVEGKKINMILAKLNYKNESSKHRKKPLQPC